ncbi:MAG: hypothetical protein AAGF11_25190 [Myxococcota bacterium]
MDEGKSGFSRPSFRSSIPTKVTTDINQELSSLGYAPVARKDFDIAHKVPFEAIRNLVMDFIYDRGSTTYKQLVKKTDALYTVDKSRYKVMWKLRDNLGGLCKHYGYQTKGAMLIIDAANALIKELNSAPDNLGLGIPTENRSIGAKPDPVIMDWDSSTSTVTYSPRTDAIDDEWDLTGSLLYDSSGIPRSSQITSYFN